MRLGHILEYPLSGCSGFPFAGDLRLRLPKIIHRPRYRRQPRRPHVAHQPLHAPRRRPSAQPPQLLHVYFPRRLCLGYRLRRPIPQFRRQ